jgi:hypothetical protein
MFFSAIMCKACAAAAVVAAADMTYLLVQAA